MTTLDDIERAQFIARIVTAERARIVRLAADTAAQYRSDGHEQIADALFRFAAMIERVAP